MQHITGKRDKVIQVTDFSLVCENFQGNGRLNTRAE